MSKTTNQAISDVLDLLDGLSLNRIIADLPALAECVGVAGRQMEMLNQGVLNHPAFGGRPIPKSLVQIIGIAVAMAMSQGVAIGVYYGETGKASVLKARDQKPLTPNGLQKVLDMTNFTPEELAEHKKICPHHGKINESDQDFPDPPGSKDN